MRKINKYWTVITRDGWPAIQMKGQDTPFIVFGNDTVLGERSAHRWAKMVCAWMNEQMRLSISSNKPVNCDAMLLKKLREAETELSNLNLENQDIHSRLMKLKRAGAKATDALHALQAFV